MFLDYFFTEHQVGCYYKTVITGKKLKIHGGIQFISHGGIQLFPAVRFWVLKFPGNDPGIVSYSTAVFTAFPHRVKMAFLFFSKSEPLVAMNTWPVLQCQSIVSFCSSVYVCLHIFLPSCSNENFEGFVVAAKYFVTGFVKPIGVRANMDIRKTTEQMN